MSNQNLAAACIEALGRVIYGKQPQIREILLALLAGGHVMLEDIPGVGKTRLARAFARVLGLEFRRVQFTPDLMPSDLTGFSVWRRDREQFVYQPGSLFCNLLLADELNRTSPKTQSALLEAMEERQVSVEGVTRALPQPFFVIATQNPLGSAGTQPLPPAQLDRFLVSLSLGYPDRDSELALVNAPADEARLAELPVLLNPRTLQALQQEIAGLYISDQVGAYLVDLVRAPEQITLLDAYRAVEGDKPLLHQDTHTNPACGVGVNIQLILRDFYQDIQQTAESRMREITLADVLAQYQARVTGGDAAGH